ncbi:MAG: NUDIX domain-containing protein [Comamonadaceae bacterium]|nr:NUDIX domain-containing protein [Comamonadaceae bacterium]
MNLVHSPWFVQLQANVNQPPLSPRATLYCDAHAIGSVEPAAFAALLAQTQMAGIVQTQAAGSDEMPGWTITSQPNAVLAELAQAMRTQDYAQVARLWRDELLAVRNASGQQLATVERGAVRALGIATHGVHLNGTSAHQQVWIQQRALAKKTDAGRWDTLMGGMVSAADTLASALQRETLEEAGLEPPQLHDLRWVGQFTMRCPNAPDNALEYVVERIDWFTAQLPAGVVPVNQDGEVQQFRRVALAELQTMLLQHAFTTEASLILAHHCAEMNEKSPSSPYS